MRHCILRSPVDLFRIKKIFISFPISCKLLLNTLLSLLYLSHSLITCNGPSMQQCSKYWTNGVRIRVLYLCSHFQTLVWSCIPRWMRARYVHLEHGSTWFETQLLFCIKSLDCRSILHHSAICWWGTASYAPNVKMWLVPIILENTVCVYIYTLREHFRRWTWRPAC